MVFEMFVGGMENREFTDYDKFRLKRTEQIISRVAVPRDADRNDALRGALRTAGTWFYEYGLSHWEKRDDTKAKRNFERSEYCRRAVAAALTPQTSGPQQPEGEG